MKCAIYSRKSTSEEEKHADNKSVTRQVEHATAFAKKRGWTVDPEHVYVDDGVSGAEFLNRPGLVRMLAALPKRGEPPFDVIVMSELSRLGRHQQLTDRTLSQIQAAKVEVWLYLSNERLKFDSVMDQAMVTIENIFAAFEREKAGLRSRDALRRKAEKGYNTGGVVYGYSNVRVESAPGVKSHTDFAINDEQADALRRIFTMYAAGFGHVTIARCLNGDPRYAHLLRQFFDGRSPASPRKGTKSWAPSSIRALLHNERYVGITTWGAHRNGRRPDTGEKVRTRQPAEAILRAERPDLRIIPPELWAEVQARLATVRKTYIRDTKGQLWGRPGTGVESRYLLSGLSECGCCGRNITMIGGRSGSKNKRTPTFFYGCNYSLLRGPTICDNKNRARMHEADELVIRRVQERILSPTVLDATVDETLRLLTLAQRADTAAPRRLQAEIKRQERLLSNLVSALEEGCGGTPLAALKRIEEREAAIAAMQRELDELTMIAPSELDLARTKRALRARLGQFDELLRSDVPLARQALRKLLAGRIRFTPAPYQGVLAYHLEWQLRVNALMDQGYIEVASPRGFESNSGDILVSSSCTLSRRAHGAAYSQHPSHSRAAIAPHN